MGGTIGGVVFLPVVGAAGYSYTDDDVKKRKHYPRPRCHHITTIHRRQGSWRKFTVMGVLAGVQLTTTVLSTLSKDRYHTPHRVGTTLPHHILLGRTKALGHCSLNPKVLYHRHWMSHTRKTHRDTSPRRSLVLKCLPCHPK